MAAMDVGIVGGLVLVGVLAGMTMGLIAGSLMVERVKRERPITDYLPPRADRPVLTDEFMADLLTRLVDASLPKGARAISNEEGGAGYVEAEYEPPLEEVPDWTDLEPDLIPQRADWMGVGPGEGVPFMDEAEEWRDKGDAAFRSWVEPVDLGDGEVVE